MKMLALPGNYC